MDAESGRGMKLEVDAFGAKRTTYLSPGGIKKSDLNARLSRSPLVDNFFEEMRSRGQQPVMLAEFTKGSDFDLEKGITMSSKIPSKQYMEVSWLKSAYLLIFCLLGRFGYQYAESESILPIREQIMNPDERIITRSIRETFPNTLPNQILFINKRQAPYCWIVKLEDSCVLLPRGGNHAAYKEVSDLPDNISFSLEIGWYPRKFGEANSIELSLKSGTGLENRNLFGQEVTAEQDGFCYKLMVVNQNGAKCTFLPSSSAMPGSGQRP